MPVKELHILLVENEPEICESAKRTLGNCSFQVSVANTYLQALRFLEKESCDVCLVDLSLAEMEGMEFLEAIFLRHPNIKVVLLTGHETVDKAIEATRKGAYDYVLKPIHPEELLLRLDRLRCFAELLEENRFLRQERTVGNLPAGICLPQQGNGLNPSSLKEAKSQFESDFLAHTLARCRGNISHSARVLKIARKNLQNKIKQFGLHPDLYRSR
ncbi:MAG: response regulator [Candidatus Tectomicrobia bacterium]|uniref:Response regulator n=1 Tax=Tectimicrobiota bacterium TaxID=2528274 RepID=A0A932GRT3_UNCTE|nr:response regulator [Candidatus Tectomicrobia bacterium]